MPVTVLSVTALAVTALAVTALSATGQVQFGRRGEPAADGEGQQHGSSGGGELVLEHGHSVGLLLSIEETKVRNQRLI